MAPSCRERFVVLEAPIKTQLETMLKACAHRPRSVTNYKRVLLTSLVQRLALLIFMLALIVNILRYTLLYNGTCIIQKQNAVYWERKEEKKNIYVALFIK